MAKSGIWGFHGFSFIYRAAPTVAEAEGYWILDMIANHGLTIAMAWPDHTERGACVQCLGHWDLTPWALAGKNGFSKQTPNTNKIQRARLNAFMDTKKM